MAPVAPPVLTPICPLSMCLHYPATTIPPYTLQYSQLLARSKFVC